MANNVLLNDANGAAFYSTTSDSSGGEGTPIQTPHQIITSNPAIAITTHIITATSEGVLLIAANPTRKSLRWMNIGENDVTIIAGFADIEFGMGMVYAAGSNTETPGQGGSDSFSPIDVTGDAFQAITNSGSTVVIVWEGN